MRRSPLRAARWLAPLLATLWLDGCATLGGRDGFVVNDSQLNWLSLSYHPTDTTRAPCRIALYGVGYVRFITGRSSRVMNEFATASDDPLWQDVKEEKIGLTPAEAQRLMQYFADAGLMAQPAAPKRRQLKETDAPGFALVSYNLEFGLFDLQRGGRTPPKIRRLPSFKQF